MKTFDIIKYKKDALIFVYGKLPEDFFFIIVNGRVKMHNYLIPNGDYLFREGDFISLSYSFNKGPYYSTAIALTEVELMAIETNSILDFIDTPLCDKIIKRMVFEIDDLTQYYINFAFQNMTEKFYVRESLLNIAKYYKANDYPFVADYIYNKYLDYHGSSHEVENVKNKIIDIGVVKNTKETNNDTAEYDKGECIFCEHEHSNDIYIVEEGKVAFYVVFNSSLLLYSISVKDDIIGYKTFFNSKGHAVSAIALENCKLKRMSREDFSDIHTNNKAFQNYFIYFMARRLYVLMMKIESINIKNILGKLYNLIYALSKYESKLNREILITIPYTIDNLMNMLGVFCYDKKDITASLLKSKSVKIEKECIVVNDIKLLGDDINIYKKI